MPALLLRNIGESLMIGDGTTLTLLAVKGEQLTLGIEAAEGVTVNRSEIFDRIQVELAKEKRENSKSVSPLESKKTKTSEVPSLIGEPDG